ncbi:IPT/TIG domain-containing protein, partial [bacterium]|nr:IPT/TIG domain-containing protein [bacterium]
SFSAKVDYPGSTPMSVAIGDLDGDGKADLAVANYSSNIVSVLRNFAALPTITSFTPTSAGNGTTVTITGTDFTGATAVSFGGTAATSFNVASATSITAVVSTGTSGDVSVTTLGGTATKTGFTFIPAPVISSFSPTSSGNGLTVTLTGTNFTGATAISFGGTAATSFNVVDATSITAVVSTGTSGNVSVTTPGGTGT